MKKYMELHNENGLVCIREQYIESVQPDRRAGTIIGMLSGAIIYVREDIKDIKW